MELSRYGEDAIRILFGSVIDPEVHVEVRRFYLFLKAQDLPEILDIIPSFRSCLIRFDSRRTSYERLRDLLLERAEHLAEIDLPPPAIHEIPVRYGGESGPDMAFVAASLSLKEEEVIRIHTDPLYTVYAVGFIPGFPYLGVLDARLSVPRLETPRIQVPQGSVGIAQLQTGIYTFPSPAGWRIIGRTDTPLFDFRKRPYSLLQIGDGVRFIPR